MIGEVFLRLITLYVIKLASTLLSELLTGLRDDVPWRTIFFGRYRERISQRFIEVLLIICFVKLRKILENSSQGFYRGPCLVKLRKCWKTPVRIGNRARTSVFLQKRSEVGSSRQRGRYSKGIYSKPAFFFWKQTNSSTVRIHPNLPYAFEYAVTESEQR